MRRLSERRVAARLDQGWSYYCEQLNATAISPVHDDSRYTSASKGVDALAVEVTDGKRMRGNHIFNQGPTRLRIGTCRGVTPCKIPSN